MIKIKQILNAKYMELKNKNKCHFCNGMEGITKKKTLSFILTK